MARGDGVPRVPDPTHPSHPRQPPMPEGREAGDARGATWPVVILGGGLLGGLPLAAIVLVAAWLRSQGIPIGPFIDELSTPLAALAGLIFAALLARVLNTSGRTQRSQGALAANQVATAEQFKILGRAVHDLGGLVHGVLDRLDRLDERVDDINDARAQGSDPALAGELRSVQQTLNEFGARLGRFGVLITGQQPTVPAPAPSSAPTATPPAAPSADDSARGYALYDDGYEEELEDDLPAAPSPAPVVSSGFGSWRSPRLAADPATGPLPTFDELVQARPDTYEPPRRRRRPPEPTG